MSKQVERFMLRKTSLIDGLVNVLEKQVEAGQRKLLEQTVLQFVDQLDITEGGKVRNTLKNKRLLQTIDTVFAEWGRTAGVAIAQSIVAGLQRVLNFNNTYFKSFTRDAELLPLQKKVTETLRYWLGIDEKGGVQKNGYLDTIINDTSVKNQIKDLTVKSVLGQHGYNETKKALKDFIVGNSEKTGVMQRYYRNFVYDTYSTVDRATGDIYAEGLGFNFAIYEGGVIKTTRKFCRERNGKVFHRSEIAAFNPPTAKPPNYDPFISLGGYSCRHHLNYIPDSTAKVLRPDAVNFIKNN